jgi:hypothetical protein
VVISGTVASSKARASVLVANILTVTVVYCLALEQSREEEGKLTYLWLLILVFLFMLYALGPLGKEKGSIFSLLQPVEP